MKKFKKSGVSLAIALLAGCAVIAADDSVICSPPIVLTAVPKGPNQINLSWPAAPNPGYGYLVEIESVADARYASWTELQPVPTAGGYTCDNTIRINGGTCNISDPTGVHVYNPPTNGVPYWVTDSTYIDPQDGSPAQFIAWGLQPNTSYSFRVRTYTGNTSPSYGAYSSVANATTAAYDLRFVSTGGDDSNDGTSPASAWRTLSYAASSLACGQVLMVQGGNYASDAIVMSQACSAGSKAVVLVNPGDTATITSVPSGVDHTVQLSGSYLVVDGLISASSSAQDNDYDILVDGHHNALLNVETHPAAVPTYKGGVDVTGHDNLLYRSYLHDSFSPDAVQNPGGNGGFVLTVQGSNAVSNVIWSNHFTRGGHDVSLCIRGCSYNRWLNNIMDGGWGMGFEAIQQSQHNLVEGNFIFDVGQLVAFYKPSIEISSGANVVRRNISVNSKSNALEISALYGEDTAANVLVYSNVFYRPSTCYFQSHNGGVSAYDGELFANNICYGFLSVATDIYLNNTNSQIVYNDILAVDGDGNPQPDQKIIIWNHDAQDTYQYPQTLVYAEASYNPPFAHNDGLDLAPGFVDEFGFDFHLAAGSSLIGAGMQVTDPDWGAQSMTADIGAFSFSSLCF